MSERKLGSGAARRMLDQGRRELAEATLAFPGQTPIAQNEVGMQPLLAEDRERIAELREREKSREREPEPEL